MKFFITFQYFTIHSDAGSRYELGSHLVHKVVFSSKCVQRESINTRNLPTTDITVLSKVHQRTRKLPGGHERIAVIRTQRLWASRQGNSGAYALDDVLMSLKLKVNFLVKVSGIINYDVMY
jgi:hypothetical protein